MLPRLSHFPNAYTYQSRLNDGPATKAIEVDEIFKNRFWKWVRSYVSPRAKLMEDLHNLVAIEVDKAEITVDRVTKSKSNKYHVCAVKDFLSEIYKESPYTNSQITIMTPYNAQIALYQHVIRDLHIATQLPYKLLPRVTTIDSMQGHESEIVILDWVCSMNGRLGFLKDNRRVNVALTRARASLILVTSITDDINEEMPRDKNADSIEILSFWDHLVVNEQRVVKVQVAGAV